MSLVVSVRGEATRRVGGGHMAFRGPWAVAVDLGGGSGSPVSSGLFLRSKKGKHLILDEVMCTIQCCVVPASLQERWAVPL